MDTEDHYWTEYQRAINVKILRKEDSMKLQKHFAFITFKPMKTDGFLKKIKFIHVITTVILSFAMSILAPVLNANIYSWTDSRGVKHFSNVPPPPDTGAVVGVKREEVYDKEADEARWELEQKEWDVLKQDLEESAKPEPITMDAGSESKKNFTGMQERIESEKFMLQTEIERLENMPALSFAGELDGKRAAIAFYRARLKMLTEDPQKYFSGL